MKSTLLPLKSVWLSVFLLVGLISFSNAQTPPPRKPDVIIMRDNSKLEVLIQEVDENVVKYKKLTDPDGPVFSIRKTEIASIKYGNGEVETFEAVLEVPGYYSPSQPTTPASQAAPAPVARNKSEANLQTLEPDRLRTIYKYYKSKSKAGMVMGIAGTSIGTLVAAIGTGIVTSSTDANGNYNSYQDQQRAVTGAWMMIGGFASAVTFGTVGFIKGGKNGAKASRVKRELLRRREPLQINFTPGFNVMTGTANLALKVTF
ncbi:hypothetical protein [Dyadobacter bucti]|uniref:hypothetical protein n=1 Tax=Dyadobacter bucti TaxID=2572203 RepID=UPI00110A0635|nr:hypothetical protein [Dyadobacter bucti]